MFLANAAAEEADESDELVAAAPVRPKLRTKKGDGTRRVVLPEVESWGSRFLGLVFRPRLLATAALMVSAFVFAPRLRGLVPELAERREYRLLAAEIEVTAPPRWVPDVFLEQVLAQSELPASLSVLDETLTEQVAAAFARHPWVEKVVSVRKSVPARVTVELEFRRPVAMVEVQQGLYPVDARGTLLPPADFSLTEARKFPAIQNVQSLPNGPAGTSWGDAAVLAAARLADVLESTGEGNASNWERFQLAAIRVPARTKADLKLDDLTLELITQGGSRIVWGRPPRSTHPGELTADQKVGRLEKYYSDFGGFDGPHGPYEIDIRHWQEISRRPLTMRGRGSRS